MGLDNSLVIRGNTIRGKKFLDEHFKKLESKYSPTRFEFDYWRKCYNLRSRFFEVFGDHDGWDEDRYEVTLKIVDLYDYVESVLKYFLNEDNWLEDRGSIWEWHIMLRSIADAICNIKEFMMFTGIEGLNDTDFHIYWYDSY